MHAYWNYIHLSEKLQYQIPFIMIKTCNKLYLSTQNRDDLPIWPCGICSYVVTEKTIPDLVKLA